VLVRALACLALISVSAAPAARGQERSEPPSDSGSQLASDDELRRAWSALRPAEKDDLAAWLEAELDRLDTFQEQLLAHVRSLDPRDPGTFPEDRRLEFFDPAVHAPGQAISRRWLEADLPRAVKLRKRMLARVPERRPASAWRYDWGAREVRRTADFRSSEHAFESSLAGSLPELDFGEALLERLLDDGSQQKALGAFERPYTDRSGGAYPGITLYDAWSSGGEFEMPDVDVLGVVHEVTDEWKRWVAPVPSRQHEELYDRVNELFAEARRFSALRSALARAYFTGTSELRDGYTFHLDRLHSLWDAHASMPAELASKLEGPGASPTFLEEWALKCEKDLALREAGRVRRARLDLEAARIRAVLARGLQEFGAFERARSPARRPAPVDEGDEGAAGDGKDARGG